MSASSHPRIALSGLYIVLDPSVFAPRDLVDVLREAAAAGARLFQYRDKAAPMREAYRQALRLREASAEVGVNLIINDRCDLALAVGADGVHVGQHDLACAHAKQLMGAGKIVGVSTHRTVEVEDATRAGADYIGFGPIFETGSKRNREPLVGLDGLRDARTRTPLPIFAIGGITAETAQAVRQAGADGIAVIGAVAKADDVTATVRTLLASLS